MGAIANAFAEAYREFNTDGAPNSGPHRPIKSAIRAIGALIENKTVAAVDTAQQLRQATRSHGRQIWMKGYNADGDGGGGLFTYDAASTATPDDGIIIQPTAVIDGAPGRWIRDLSYASAIHFAWFGPNPVYGPGSDCTSQFLNWIAAIQRIHLPGFAGPGRYRMSQVFVSMNAVRTTGMTLIGAGRAHTIFDFREAASPNLMFYCDHEDARDNNYLVVRSLSILGEVPGIVVQLGQDDFSDPMNVPIFDDVSIQNFDGSDDMIALRVNYVTAIQYHGQINGGSGDFVGGHGKALDLRQCVFGTWRISAGTAEYMAWMNTGFNYGNLFLAPDIENVKTCWLIDTPFAANNKAVTGQYGYSRNGIVGLQGSNFIFDTPNYAPTGTLNTTGLTVSGSAVITGIPNTWGCELGRAITGTGVPVGATVLSVDDAHTVTMSANATATTPTGPGDPPTALTFAGASSADFVKRPAVGVIVRSHGTLPVVTPSVPASGVGVLNDQGIDMNVVFWSATSVTVSGSSFTLTSGPLPVRAGQTITPTHGGSMQWRWISL